MPAKVIRQSPSGMVKVFDDGTMLIKDARLSYEHLFKKWAGKPGPDGKQPIPKFSGQFMLPIKTRTDDIKFIRNECQTLAVAEPKIGAKLPSDRICIREGDPGKEEMKGMWVFKASEDSAPSVVDKDGQTPITEESGKVYSGVYVSVLVRLWAQANGYGKRINANLLSVQLLRKGEAFGGGPRPAPKDVFDAVDDDEDDLDGNNADDGFDDEDDDL